MRQNAQPFQWRPLLVFENGPQQVASLTPFVALQAEEDSRLVREILIERTHAHPGSLRDPSHRKPAKRPLRGRRCLSSLLSCGQSVKRQRCAALNDAAPLYRDAPEAIAAKTSAHAAISQFMEEVLPHRSDAQRALVADLLKTTLSQVGKHFSETPRADAEIEAYSDAMADMFSAYLTVLC